jgi:hypothetical protein
LQNDFPGLTFADDFEEESSSNEVVVQPQEEKVEYFYLWDTLEDILTTYKILRNYHDKDYHISSIVLIELIKANNLDMVRTLEYVPYIHSGYISILLEDRNTKDGNEES